jgi:hypothetical protein
MIVRDATAKGPLQDHKLDGVQRVAQGPSLTHDLTEQRHAVVRTCLWQAGSPANLLGCRYPIFLSIKCLFGLALRQSLGLIQSLLHLAGLAWRVPDFSTLSRYQKTLQVQLPYRCSSTALDLLVDSTSIMFLGEGEWKRKKHGAQYRRPWRKVHLGIDASTLET